MPVDFLNDDQAAAYGGYVRYFFLDDEDRGEVEEAELQRYFFLDDEDRGHIDRRRREANRDRARSAERAICRLRWTNSRDKDMSSRTRTPHDSRRSSKLT